MNMCRSVIFLHKTLSIQTLISDRVHKEATPIMKLPPPNYPQHPPPNPAVYERMKSPITLCLLLKQPSAIWAAVWMENKCWLIPDIPGWGYISHFERHKSRQGQRSTVGLTATAHICSDYRWLFIYSYPPPLSLSFNTLHFVLPHFNFSHFLCALLSPHSLPRSFSLAPRQLTSSTSNKRSFLSQKRSRWESKVQHLRFRSWLNGISSSYKLDFIPVFSLNEKNSCI